MMEVHEVGDVGNREARKVRIVHISDTHLKHDSFLDSIQEGDILIHSGDFAKFGLNKFFQKSEFDEVVQEMDTFFGKLNFKHKIFIAGNHEMCFKGYDPSDIQARLKNVTYLQDTALEVEGIRIYGSPWTATKWFSWNRGFTRSMGIFGDLGKTWDKIPNNIDILVTHMPPEGILDLGADRFPILNKFFLSNRCSVCYKEHKDFSHWGCPDLKSTVINRVRPKIHMYGHVHEGNGVEEMDGILFSNAAMDFVDNPIVFDYYVSP